MHFTFRTEFLLPLEFSAVSCGAVMSLVVIFLVGMSSPAGVAYLSPGEDFTSLIRGVLLPIPHSVT